MRLRVPVKRLKLSSLLCFTIKFTTMKLICKDTNKGSITFFTKGKYAFRGVDRNDTTDDVILYWMLIITMRVYSFIPRPPACARSIGVTGIKSNFLS